MTISGLNKGGLIRGWFFDERSQGLEDIARAEELARDVDDPTGLVESCMHQCYLRTGHGEFEQVEFYMEEVTRLGADIGDPEPVLFGMTHLSNTLVMVTRFDEALEQSEKTLAYAREHGNLHYQAEILTWAIPTCHLRNGDVEAATAAIEEGMEIAMQIGHRPSEALAAYIQGRIAMERGYFEEALRLFRRTKSAGDATGFPNMRALGACAVGTCYLTIGGGLIEDALRLHEETLEFLEMPIGSTFGTQLWSEIGHCALAAGHIDDAKELFAKAMAEKTTFTYLARPSAMIGQIDVAIAEGRSADAIERLGDLEEYISTRGMDDWRPAVLLAAAKVAAETGDHAAALDHLAECGDLAVAAGTRKVLLDVHMARTASLRAMGRTDEAAVARAAAGDLAASISAEMHDEALRAAFVAGVEDGLA